MKKLAGSLLLAGGLLFGCTANDAQETPSSKEVAAPKTAASQDTPSHQEGKESETSPALGVDIEQAFSIFKEKYSQAKVDQIEFEEDHGKTTYNIEGLAAGKQYEMTIDGQSGDVLKESEEVEQDEKAEITPADLDKVGHYIEQAKQEAGVGYEVKEYELKVKSEGKKFDLKLKTKDGQKLKYKFDFETGEILEKETD